MKNLIQEAENLKKLADTYSIQIGIEKIQALFDFEAIIKQVKGETLLEIGCADGTMTVEFLNAGFKVHAVDGAEGYTKKTLELVNKLNLKNKNNLSLTTSLIENLEIDKKFDNIVLSNVIHHLESPSVVLKSLKRWLNKDGLIHVIIPNSNSLHRVIAYHMSLIKATDELSDSNKNMFHKRVFSYESARSLLIECNLKIKHFEGIFLKPLSLAQMSDFSDELLKALNEVAKIYPLLSHHLYFVCAI